MTKPDFFVIGAQKSATTWLSECLREHPDIFVPEIKETHFFCPPENCRRSTWHDGFKSYEDQFGPGKAKICGELTPDYMFYPGIAERLKAYAPDAKIIILLRDPVDRAYSAYWMHRKYDPNLPPFAEAMAAAPAHLERGLYYRQIRRYLDVFPAEQMRIMVYEEIMSDRTAALRALFSFLGVDPAFRPASEAEVIAAARELPPGVGWVLYKLIGPVINTPLVLPVWRWLRAHTNLKEMVLNGLTLRSGGKTAYSPLPTAERERFAAYFRDENEKLYSLLGRRIPEWTP